jgi:anthranilate phosphoribosyltransferase
MTAMTANPAFDAKAVLGAIAAGRSLSSDEIFEAFDHMTAGEATAAQMGAFLMGLRVRGETVEELTGAARLLRSRMLPVRAPADAVDIVGTGGDGLKTYNVSTCAAFVAAGAGLVIAKHGNRSVSSLSGASDVLTALGVKIDLGAEQVTNILDETGIGFLWAPLHHPAMKVWAPIRAELGLRTVFNLMGPVCNPAGVVRQVIGVYSADWVEPIAQVLENLGSVHAWVVHGHDGLDELSTTGPTRVAELKNGKIATFEVTPEEAGLPRAALADLKGGDAAANASALRVVLDGTRGAYRDIVLMNAGAALVVGDKAASLAEGVALAAASIDSGAARRALERLITASNAA